MLTDEDVLEKEDMYILDKIKEFVSNPEVSNSVAAAKQLVVLIDRVVSLTFYPDIGGIFLRLYSNEEAKVPSKRRPHRQWLLPRLSYRRQQRN